MSTTVSPGRLASKSASRLAFGLGLGSFVAFSCSPAAPRSVGHVQVSTASPTARPAPARSTADDATLSGGEVYLDGALLVGTRGVAVLGTAGTHLAVLPLPLRDDGSSWTVLSTGMQHDEEAAFADPRLGPYCGP